MAKPSATDLIIDALSNYNINSISNDNCNICFKSVLKKQKNDSFLCSHCNKWSHKKCDDVNNKLNSNEHCLKCSISFIHVNIPFTLCNNLDLLNLNASNSTKFLNSLPTLEIISEISKISDLSSSDVDLNLAYQYDCSYYSVNDIQNLNLNKNLNIFHSNINGLESKFENLHEFLFSTKSKMDIVALTETSERKFLNLMSKLKDMEIILLPLILVKAELLYT